MNLFEQNFRSNIWKMYIFKFFTNLHFTSGVLVPFFTQWGGISFTQVMILQSWFLFWIFVLEIPTGTIADYFGRKHSVALAAFIGAISALIYGLVPNFYVFLLAEFLWAISASLLSGADQAFVYDSLKKIKKSKQSKKVFGRIRSFNLAGIMVSGPIGSVIAYYFGLNAPMILTSVPVFIAFLVSLTLKEPVTKVNIESKRYLDILKRGIKYFHGNTILKIIALDQIIIGSVSYFMIWLYQPILERAGVPLIYFGFMHAGMALGQIIIINNFERLENILGSKKRLLFGSSLITGLAFVLGGLTSYLPFVLISILLVASFGLSRRPLLASYMNKHIPSEERSTILSTVSMLNKFVLVVVNPIVGVLTEWSLSYLLIMLGVVAVLFAFISRVEEEHLLD
jgi:MFS family permease